MISWIYMQIVSLIPTFISLIHQKQQDKFSNIDSSLPHRKSTFRSYAAGDSITSYTWNEFIWGKAKSQLK